MLDIQKMTEKTREALATAGAAAREYGHQEIRPIHLLSALAHQEGGLLPSLLKRIGTPNQLLSDAVEAELAKLPKVTGNAVDVYPLRSVASIMPCASAITVSDTNCIQLSIAVPIFCSSALRTASARSFLSASFCALIASRFIMLHSSLVI